MLEQAGGNTKRVICHRTGNDAMANKAGSQNVHGNNM